MASSIKIKFAGFLRGLLRHVDDREVERPVASISPSASAPAPAPTTAVSAAANENNDFSSQPLPPINANANEISLPLASVIAHLPMDLKAKLMSTPAVGQIILLPVEKIVSQLAFGSVKISFGDLRRLAPGVFANSGGEFDSRQISLPLVEILSRLNPALLARKPVQKVDVAEDVAGPFDGRGRGITFTTQPLKPSAASPTVTESKQLNQPVPFTAPPVAPSAVLPSRAATPAISADTEVFSFKPRQTAPPSAPIPFNPPPIISNGNGNGHTNGNTNGNGHAHGNGNGNGNGHANGNTNAGLPPFKFTTAPAPSAPVNSSSPRPEPAQPKLFFSLDDLAEGWSEELRGEIACSKLANASVPLPMNLVEAGLKRGRVSMLWKELRIMAMPSSAASPHDGQQLDLPLKVLAPAFLSAQKQAGKMQKRVAVNEEIPNLFFGFPQPSAEAAAPSAPAAQPVPVGFTPQKAADTNFFTASDPDETPTSRGGVATDFINRHTHPQEVVARAMVLPGVAGAVVTLADGLRVASQVPTEMNADAVAAFLPQIFERVNQSTRELRMGALNNVGFTVGAVPWKIFRINSIYFAAFGRAGEALPKAQLAGLAAELDRKKQF